MAYHGKYPYRIAEVQGAKFLLIIKDNAGHRIVIAGEAFKRFVKANNYKAPDLGQDIRQVSRVLASLNIRTH